MNYIRVIFADENTYTSIEEGLYNMKTQRVVIHVSYGTLKSAFLTNPSLSQKVIVFGFGESSVWPCIIFQKHSPFTKMFRRAVLQLRESGVISRLQTQWEGKDVPEVPTDVRNVSLNYLQRLIVGFCLSALTKRIKDKIILILYIKDYIIEVYSIFILELENLFNLSASYL